MFFIMSTFTFRAKTVVLLLKYFECRTFTCNRVFLHCGTATFTEVKYLSTSSTCTCQQQKCELYVILIIVIL